MSAFLVGKPHLDGLVALALLGPRPEEGQRRWSPISWYAAPVNVTTPYSEAQRLYRTARPECAEQIGQMLLDANLASLQARYGDENAGDTYHVSFAHLLMMRRPTALEGLKMVHCFDYQACEDAGWPDSEARRFLDSLEQGLMRSLPGYDQAKGWEWRG